LAFAPLEGMRHVKITSHRGKSHYAHFLAELSDWHFPHADKIVLVQDNLNTHGTASLYATFEPAKARRLADRFEWNDPSKRGSWLNMAGVEFSALSRQCLKDRIASHEDLASDVSAWTKARNSKKCSANWQFTNKNARIKLRKLYPSI